MNFGIEIVPNEPVKNIIDLIKLAEDIGFEYLWITDHYNNKNVYEILTLASYETSTIKIGSGVSNPYIRNPALIASATTTLDEISEGRAIVGVGPGDKATMNSLNIKWNKPVATVRNAIEEIRTLIHGDKTKSGAYLDGTKKVQEKIPIYMGAQGPKMLETSGEIADGALINASNPKDFENALPLIKKGLEHSNRSLKDFDIAAYTCCSVDNDLNTAYNQTRIVVAFIIAGAPDIILKRYNIPKEDVEIIKKCLSRQDFKGASSNVTEDMINAFSVCGTPNQIQNKITELEDKGVTQFVAGSPIGKDKFKSLKLLEDVINSF